jgi:hypothetical protein
MKTLRLSVALITILLFSCTMFFGQDFQLHSKVDPVVVSVSARDGNGRLVTSLTKDDFTILEDGKPQTISDFSIEPQPLPAVFILDSGTSGPLVYRFTPLNAVMTRWLKESDEAAAYRYDHFVTKLSDITNNPQAIERSFDAVKQTSDAKPANSEMVARLGPSPLQWIGDRLQIGSNGAPPMATTPSTSPAITTRARPAPPGKVLPDAVFAAALDLEKWRTDRGTIVALISDGTIETKEQSFAKLVEETRYILSYVSNNEISGTRPVFRKIEVKARNQKVTIVYRRGYLQYP